MRVPRHLLKPPLVFAKFVILFRSPRTTLLYGQDSTVRQRRPHRSVWKTRTSPLSCWLRKSHRLLPFPRDHADLTARTCRNVRSLRPRNHLTRFDQKNPTSRRTGDGSHKVNRRDTVLRQNLNLCDLPCLLTSKSTLANLLTNARRALTKKVSPLPTPALAVMRPHLTRWSSKNALPGHLV